MASQWRPDHAHFSCPRLGCSGSSRPWARRASARRTSPGVLAERPVWSQRPEPRPRQDPGTRPLAVGQRSLIGVWSFSAVRERQKQRLSARNRCRLSRQSDDRSRAIHLALRSVDRPVLPFLRRGRLDSIHGWRPWPPRAGPDSCSASGGSAPLPLPTETPRKVSATRRSADLLAPLDRCRICQVGQQAEQNRLDAGQDADGAPTATGRLPNIGIEISFSPN